MGALHPVLFLLTIYVISVVLAFFVCTTIYNSLNGPASLVQKNMSKTEGYAALK